MKIFNFSNIFAWLLNTYIFQDKQGKNIGIFILS